MFSHLTFEDPTRLVLWSPLSLPETLVTCAMITRLELVSRIWNCLLEPTSPPHPTNEVYIFKNTLKVYYFLKYLLVFVFLFIWPPWVSVVAWRSLVTACQLLICGIWDLVPQLGIELRALPLGTWSLSCWTTREVPVFFSFCKWRYGWCILLYKFQVYNTAIQFLKVIVYSLFILWYIHYYEILPIFPVLYNMSCNYLFYSLFFFFK